jgi:glycosyltransferase involved in cell wall biosynthesis
MMTVTVIIPTHNREKEISRALKSVFAQTYPVHEVIVVDDGSNDGTVSTVKAKFPSVQIIQFKTNVGGSVARNTGAKKARGELISFLDSDDEWLPDHLADSINFLVRTNADGVYRNFFNERNGIRTEIPFVNDYFQKTRIGNLILGNSRFDARTSTFVFRRETFLKVGFDEKLRKHQDWDLAINFSKSFCFNFLNNPTVVIHLSNSYSRMSSKLNHSSSIYFAEKNRHLVSSEAMFLFAFKLAHRCEMNGEPNSSKNVYLDICRKSVEGVPFYLRIIFWLVCTNMVSVSFFHKLKSLMRKLK